MYKFNFMKRIKIPHAEISYITIVYKKSWPYYVFYGYGCWLPEGILSDDQTSCGAKVPLRGGQLMTGKAVLPDNTGPSPLLRPAIAINTHGTPKPKIRKNYRKYF